MQTTTLQTSRKLIEMGFKNEGEGWYVVTSEHSLHHTENVFRNSPMILTHPFKQIKLFTLCELLEACPNKTSLVKSEDGYECCNTVFNEYENSDLFYNPCESVADFLIKNKLIGW